MLKVAKLKFITLAVAFLIIGAASHFVVDVVAAPAYPPRNSDAGSVSVVVTPKPIETGARVWEFSVTMNTHIKPLGEDLTIVSVLVDDSGRRTKPLAWKGDAPGGHHRKGILQFPAPETVPKIFEVQMAGVGGVSLRTFRWDSKQ